LDGLAVVCGAISGGLTCRDFDEEAAYTEWRARYPHLAAKLPTVRTGKGFHVYFRSSCRSIRHLGDGELRGNGYCLLPPSIHPSGRPYKWVVPLPAGDLPCLDPAEAGLAPPWTERTESTERTEDHRETKSNIQGVLAGASQKLGTRNQADSELEKRIDQAIRATLPRRPGERNQRIFDFARHLKAIPALAEADPRELRPVIKRWHAAALAVITTIPFEDTWGDFQYAWSNVRFPKGEDPVEPIFERAEQQPFPAEAGLYEAPETKRLVRFCREFQRAVGDHPFFLSCRTAARLFGMDYRTAATRLKAMRGDGLLQVVDGGGMKANRYRYCGRL
jgi:hypothetical protein